MISHKKQFIIITPPKTGSVSLTTALSEYLDIKRIIKQISDCYDYTESDSDRAAKHKDVKDYAKFIDSYTIFGSVRNPFDRVVSWWKWLPTFDKRYNNISFIDFLHIPLLQNKIFDPQYNFFTHNNKYVVSDIIRFENLQEDFDKICDKIQIPRKELPHKNKTNHKHYTEYYDDKTREIVESKYSKDIEYFGYKFEGVIDNKH